MTVLINSIYEVHFNAKLSQSGIHTKKTKYIMSIRVHYNWREMEEKQVITPTFYIAPLIVLCDVGVFRIIHKKNLFQFCQIANICK